MPGLTAVVDHPIVRLIARGLVLATYAWAALAMMAGQDLLTNPIYAGAYVFGRTGSSVTIEAGRKRIVRGFRKDRGAWEVLIPDHHEGYIGWAEFERNQRLIADNANGKSFMSRGSIRRGEALLAGLLRCGHCGRKLHERANVPSAARSQWKKQPEF